MNLFSTSTVILALSGIVFSLLVYRTDRANKINRAWFFSCIAFSAWAVGLSGVTLSATASAAFLWQYLLDISAVFLPYLYLIFVFELVGLRARLMRGLLLSCAIVFALFSLTPFFKVGMVILYGFEWIKPGPYYYLFLYYFIFYALLSIGLLVYGYFKASKGSVQRSQIRNTILGAIMGYGGGVTNFFPQLFSVYPYGNYLVILYIVFMVYGVLRYKLLSAKVIGAQIFSTALILITLFNLLRTTSIDSWLLNFIIFVVVGALSIFLIRSVNQEVKSREALAVANAGQQQFIHYLNHESKGYLTEDNAVLAAVRDGDFGEAPAELQKMATTVLRKNRRAVDDIDEMILSADLGSGAVRYTMEPFDLAAETRAFVEEYRPDAEEKGQKLEFVTEPAGADFTIVGDKRRLMRHALKNYLKNAIVYTPAGGAITVTLSRAGEGKDAKVTLGVRDSGVGITPEDKARLFTEGGKGLHSTDVNPNSTGRGLYIVKQIIEAHHGRVFADSAGAGKGSTFGFEVPVGR